MKNKGDKSHMTKLGISENLLTVTLKRQIKDLRKEITKKDEEITKLK